MILKVPCRNCGVNIEHEDWMANNEAKCPACGQMTLLAPIHINSGDITREKILQDARRNWEGKDISSKEIRKKSERFRRDAFWSLVLAGIAFIGAILGAANENDSGLAIICLAACGGFLCLWFWFYLLAQIIHIRANTAKE
jgi:hypothetical protein